MTRKATKYIYWLVTQADYGYGDGWEDVDWFDKSDVGYLKDARNSLKEYRFSCPSARYRTINRRELRPTEIV